MPRHPSSLANVLFAGLCAIFIGCDSTNPEPSGETPAATCAQSGCADGERCSAETGSCAPAPDCSLTGCDFGSRCDGETGACVVESWADPSIAEIADLQTDEDTPIAVTLSVSPGSSAWDALTLTATADDADLLPPDQLAISGSGIERTLLITPAPDHFGAATVTVAISDGERSGSVQFELVVRAVNDAPILSAPDGTSFEAVLGQTLDPIVLTVEDADSVIDQAGLTTQFDGSLIASAAFGGGAGSWRLHVSTRPEVTGTETILVSASDGIDADHLELTITVTSPASVAPTVVQTVAREWLWGSDIRPYPKGQWVDPLAEYVIAPTVSVAVQPGDVLVAYTNAYAGGMPDLVDSEGTFTTISNSGDDHEGSGVPMRQRTWFQSVSTPATHVITPPDLVSDSNDGFFVLLHLRGDRVQRVRQVNRTFIAHALPASLDDALPNPLPGMSLSLSSPAVAGNVLIALAGNENSYASIAGELGQQSEGFTVPAGHTKLYEQQFRYQIPGMVSWRLIDTADAQLTEWSWDDAHVAIGLATLVELEAR